MCLAAYSDSLLDRQITGLYYSLGTIGTVPRAYDILGPTKDWKGEKYK
jgi:hypothetical protein